MNHNELLSPQMEETYNGGEPSVVSLTNFLQEEVRQEKGIQNNI